MSNLGIAGVFRKRSTLAESWQKKRASAAPRKGRHFGALDHRPKATRASMQVIPTVMLDTAFLSRWCAHPSKRFPRQQQYRVTAAIALSPLSACRTLRRPHPRIIRNGASASRGAPSRPQGVAPLTNPLRHRHVAVTRTLDASLGFRDPASGSRLPA
jgi:hypothetical protein